jgi:hypothetical protein
MPCSKLEVSTVQHGTLSGAGYLHQSRIDHEEMIVGAAGHERHAFREKRRRERLGVAQRRARIRQTSAPFAVTRGRTAEKWELSVRAVKPISRSQLNGGFGARTGPYRGESCMGVVRRGCVKTSARFHTSLFRSLLRGLRAFRVERIAKSLALLDRLQNFAEFLHGLRPFPPFAVGRPLADQ